MPRPKRPVTTALMLTAARMYHNDNRTKLEIAQSLRTTTRHVAELLTEARNQGVVKISIFESAAQELEGELIAKYPHLKKAIIAVGERISTPDQYAGLIKQWGGGVAEFFEELPDQFPGKVSLNIGMTGGRQILEFANAIPNKDRQNIFIQVAALVGRGRLQRTATHIDPIVNASVLWTRCGYLPGHCEFATVSPHPLRKPGLKSRQAARTELDAAEQNQAIAQVVHAMDNIDVVFAGIGLVKPDDVDASLRDRLTVNSLLESVVTPQDLEAEGAVGSMAYCFFDKFGNGKEDWRFWLTAGHFSEQHWGIEFYKRMIATGKLVVGFGNPFGLKAIRVALKAKMFNVLVTDEFSARQLVKGD